jgi:hypothetical protein
MRRSSWIQSSPPRRFRLTGLLREEPRKAMEEARDQIILKITSRSVLRVHHFLIIITVSLSGATSPICPRRLLPLR